MNEADATYCEVGTRLLDATSLPPDVALIRDRVATLKHVNDDRVQREAAIELGREAIRLHGLALVPDDLRNRVHEFSNTDKHPKAPPMSVTAQTRSQQSTKQALQWGRKVPGYLLAGVILLALFNRIANIEWPRYIAPTNRPVNQTPPRYAPVRSRPQFTGTQRASRTPSPPVTEAPPKTVDQSHANVPPDAGVQAFLGLVEGIAAQQQMQRMQMLQQQERAAFQNQMRDIQRGYSRMQGPANAGGPYGGGQAGGGYAPQQQLEGTCTRCGWRTGRQVTQGSTRCIQLTGGGTPCGGVIVWTPARGF